ncbi:MAG: TetR family transcriptional regulator [Actinomycetota bacterium]
MATRRTQAERSASTQHALIEAAIESLVERGWAATTAVEVCQRAGVTRGALMHHVPDLSSLLARALETVYQGIRVEPPDTLVGFVDTVEEAVTNPRFVAVIEAWMAAGNDPELAQEIGPAISRFAKLIDPSERLGDLGVDAVTFCYTARETAIGLALGRAVTGDAVGHEELVFDDLRARATELDRTRS